MGQLEWCSGDTSQESAVHQNLSSEEIDEMEVLNLWRRFQIDKSPAPNGTHSRVFKECVIEIAHPLTVLFQSSLREGILPEKWRDANVTPGLERVREWM